MDTSIIKEIYEVQMMANEIAFNVGQYEAAYYDLMGALSCAEQLDTNEPLEAVRNRAIEQLAFIDQNHAEFKFSTQSSKARGQRDSVFATPPRMVDAILQGRLTKFGRNYR